MNTLRPALVGLGLLLSHAWGSAVAQAEERPVFSGAFIGPEAGASGVTDSGQSESRIGGRALTVGVRGNVSLWQNLVLGIGMHIFDFDDRAPYTEQVVDCQSYNGRITSCDDDAHAEKSDVTSVMLSYEAGYQPQFRLHDDLLRLSPALLFGYAHTLRPIERSVECVDCPEGERLPLSISAPYFAGAAELALPFGIALTVRSQWYLVGDLVHTTVCGLGYYID